MKKGTDYAEQMKGPGDDNQYSASIMAGRKHIKQIIWYEGIQDLVNISLG